MKKMQTATYLWLLASCLTAGLAGAVPLEHQKTSSHPPLKDRNIKDDGRNTINDNNNINGNKDKTKDPPNIIMIIADDMGWNDVSFHGSDQISTPNIDALAYNGVILNSHYVSAMCTPSRAAMLTGKHPIHLGMQHLVIFEAEPRGLPLSEKILPQYLKELGYSTHALGKWHQGFHRREYTPTYRGFDTHFGYWNGLQDYYTHEVASSRASENYLGFDMRRNMSVAHDTRGKYSTDLFTEEAVRLIDEHDTEAGPMFMYFAHLAPHSGNEKEPLQAPDEYVAKFGYIDDPERRIYAAMMAKLDESVGEVVAALRRRHMLQNSVVIFMADNGAATQGIHYNRGSNYPLRGIKASAWEGAIRGAAAVWSPLIRRPKRVSDELMYIGDWMPTLLTLAGGEDRIPEDIDGMDMWPSISEGLASPRQELLGNIDPVFNYSSLRRGDFKYVLGSVGNGEEWYGESGRIERASIEGRNPTYDGEAVISSAAGRAISALLTKQQALEIRTLRSTTYNKVKDEDMSTASLLTADEILSLRAKATLHCTVSELNKVACNPLESACLFNIREDPCEQRNLASSHPSLVAALEKIVEKYKLSALPPSNTANDPRANPGLWNNTWVSWLDDDPMEFQRLGEDQKTATSSGNGNSNGATVSKNPLVVEDGTGLNGSVLLLALVILALAVLAIVAMLYLSCSARYNRLRKKEKQSAYDGSRHFQEIHEPTEIHSPDLRNEKYVATKLLEKNGKIDTISSNGIEC